MYSHIYIKCNIKSKQSMVDIKKSLRIVVVVRLYYDYSTLKNYARFMFSEL